MRHRDKHMTVFCHYLWFEKIRIKRTYLDKSQYAKHGSGYRDLVYYKYDHRFPTEKHLKLHNLMSLIEFI